MIEGDSVTYVRNCKMKKREKRKLEPRIALINDVSFIAMDIKRASLRTESKRTHTHLSNNIQRKTTTTTTHFGGSNMRSATHFNSYSLNLTIRARFIRAAKCIVKRGLSLQQQQLV